MIHERRLDRAVLSAPTSRMPVSLGLHDASTSLPASRLGLRAPAHSGQAVVQEDPVSIVTHPKSNVSCHGQAARFVNQAGQK